MSEINLGNWAVIDLETSGVNPNDDSIIDVGFLQFEGTKLVRKYNSLVRFPMSPLHHDNYSQFIQKLTGISPKMLKSAPLWEDVLPEVQSLVDHHLLAHNSDFEKSFLSDWMELSNQAKYEEEESTTSYEDSMYYLSLLHPEKTSLKLETFISDYGIREHEIHRGYEDALDLLKVLLLATINCKRHPLKERSLIELFNNYGLNSWWYGKFFHLNEEELLAIADQIDLDVDFHLEYHHQLMKKQKDEKNLGEQEKKFNEIDAVFSGQNIKKILENEENIQAVLPGYKFRQGQLDLAVRVGQALKNDTHALIQAPTGTGKTLGYLLPAALFTLTQKAPVLMATGTKALQEQAMQKDIPQVKKLLGKNNVKFTHLVGSNNHLCELLFRSEVSENDLFAGVMSFEEKFTYAYFDLLFQHNAISSYNDKKLRADVPYVLKKKFNFMMEKDQSWATDYRSCSGRNCPYKNECSYVEGIREAKESDIIIGNHALMYSWPKSIPRPNHIIIDEAHKIENETTSACSVSIEKKDLEKVGNALKNMTGLGALFYLLAKNEQNPGDSTPVIKKIREELTGQSEMLHDHLLPLDDLCEKFFKKLPRYTSIYWNEVPFSIKAMSRDPLGKNILNHLESINHILEVITQFLLPYASRWESKDFKDEAMITAWTKFESFFSHFSDTSSALSEILNEENTNSDISWSKSFRYHEEYGFNLLSAPVNVGKVIHQHLLQNANSVVFTSATLGNAFGNHGTKGVEWATGYLYLENERRFKTGMFLPPLYDYPNQTKIFFCDDVPNLYDQKFVSHVLDKTTKVSEDLGGRSLFLFSAKARFEKAREYLLEKFEGVLPVFIQGMGNNVVEDFKNAENGILLGMESFGEGIDIPGESLQFIFIDKIPDLRMDQVINDRRDFYEQNIGNEFTDYYLGHRTRSLHQKLGRLIRRESDFGGVIVVDSRIKKWKGKTLEKLYRLMEPYEISRAPLDQACFEVTEFIQQKNNKSTISSPVINDLVL